MTTSNIELIKEAWRDGLLYGHMFEDAIEEEGPVASNKQIKNLFDVIACKKGSRYSNQFRDVTSDEYGFFALSTTPMHEKYPVLLWTDKSRVGILINGRNEDSVHPIFVSSCDAYTGTIGKRLSFHGAEPYRTLRLEQGIKPDVKAIDFSDFSLDDIMWKAQRCRATQRALWRDIEQTGWKSHIDKIITDIPETERPGMGETNLWTSINGVIGIVVFKAEALFSEREIIPYKDSVKAANDLKAWLSKKYPSFMNNPLPIMSYDLKRNVQKQETSPELEELTPEKIRFILDAGKGKK